MIRICRIVFVSLPSMIYFVISLVVATLIIDFVVWQRLIRSRVKSESRARMVLALMWSANLLPALMSALYLLANDNTTFLMNLSMWAIFAFAVIAIPKSMVALVILLFRRVIARIFGFVAIAAYIALLIYSVAVTRCDIKISHIELHYPSLPESFDGFRVAQFSDLHIGTLVNPKREVSHLVQKINSTDADVVVFTGDLINVRPEELTPSLMHTLGSIRSRHGIYSITGNHDMGYYIKDSINHPHSEALAQLLKKERDMGWNLLDNESRIIVRGVDTISITGISFADTLRKLRHAREIPLLDIRRAYGDLSPKRFNITLAHIPQMWSEIVDCGYADLTLSGHVHSMQVKCSLFGVSISPARIVYPKWSGLYSDDENIRHLYINDGIGYVGAPMRVGARPEITIITLRR